MWQTIVTFLTENQVVLGSGASVVAIVEMIFAPFRTIAKKLQKPDAMVVPNHQPTLPKGIHADAESFAEFQRINLKEALADQAAAHGEERHRLEQKIEALYARLADPERALAEQQAIITNLEEQLGGDAKAEAKAALIAGDFTKARALFTIRAAQTEPYVKIRADAVFALGQIAETEIRWHDAATLYGTAARLNPTFDTLYKAREYAWRAGNYPAAFRDGEDLLAWAKSQGTQEQLATALNEHALTVSAQGNYSQAEALFLQALEIAKSTIGIAHPIYAIRLNNVAKVVELQGRFAEAEALHLQSLEIVKATVGTAHPDYAFGLNNLASVVHGQGWLAKAEALCLQALEIDKATIGTAHPEYAKHLNNIAGVVRAQGRIDEARGLLVQSLVIFRDKLGDGHPYTVGTAKNLLSLLQSHFPEDPEISALQALLAAQP